MELIVYLIWALLPITLFTISLRAYYRRLRKIPLREDAKDYFKQGLFATIALVAAVFWDQTSFPTIVRSVVSAELVDPDIFRWVLYPGILAAMAVLVERFHGRKTKGKSRTTHIYRN